MMPRRSKHGKGNKRSSPRRPKTAVHLELGEGARAIAPGQSGVLYDGARLLDGGISN